MCSCGRCSFLSLIIQSCFHPPHPGPWSLQRQIERDKRIYGRYRNFLGQYSSPGGGRDNGEGATWQIQPFSRAFCNQRVVGPEGFPSSSPAEVQEPEGAHPPSRDNPTSPAPPSKPLLIPLFTHPPPHPARRSMFVLVVLMISEPSFSFFIRRACLHNGVVDRMRDT